MSAPDTPDAEAAPLGAAHEPTATSAALIERAPLPRGVAPYVLSDDELRLTWRAASALATSGIFKDATKGSVEVAFAKVMIGRDLGISPTQALMTIDLVQGSIQLRGVLLASFIRRSATYEYQILESDHAHARVRMIGFPTADREDGLVRFRGQWWEALGEETFTVEDAKTAGLFKPGGNWQKYPKNMCVWRSLSNLVKFYAPELLGGVPVYVEGEVIPAAALGDGAGDGQPQGIDLGPDVEAVLARAADLGHAALTDRATIEMLLGDQPPAKVVEWVRAANRELDALPQDAEVVEAQERRDVPAQPSDAAEPVEGEAVVEDIEVTRRRVENLLADADAAEADGDTTTADALRDEAAPLMEMCERADAGQESLAI